MPARLSTAAPRWALLALGLIPACNGSLDRGAIGPEGSDVCLEPAAEIAVPMRRLMPEEYQAALEEMFGPAVPATGATYPVPLSGYEYRTFADAHRVGEAQAEALLVTAENVAEAIGPGLTACDAADFATCARTTLSGWAGRAFRRAPEDADVDRLLAVAVGAHADGMPPNEALAVAVIALLQEPRFLYVVESRAGLASWALDDSERAQRLALTFWQALPDETLTMAAFSGALSTPSGMAEASEHVVADPRAQIVFRRFVREWLGVGSRPSTFAPDVEVALHGELDLLIDEAWAADDGLSVLLGSDAVYADSVLEAFYGLPSVSTGPGDYHRVARPGERVGVLTHPLVLAGASHGEDSSPILRGKLIRTRLLCGELGTPPVGAAEREPMLPATATARERYEARIVNSVCAQCHVQMDPIGFGFESWDGLGRYRTELGGRPVDTLAEVTRGGDVSGEYASGTEMIEALATSDDVADCFASQWARYALGRDAEDEVMCLSRELGADFREHGRSIPAMFSTLAESPSFVSRAAEVTP